MTLQTRLIPSITSTLIVAGVLLAGAQSTPAKASGPDTVLTAGMEELAAEFGDLLGRISSVNMIGATSVLAVDTAGSYGVYIGGDVVGFDDTFAFCIEDPAIGLSSCEEVAPPGSDAYDCDADDQHTWCSCNGMFDCFGMITDGICTEHAVCEGNSCTCEVR